MTVFETSPRSAKRRKIIADVTSILPISQMSRAAIWERPSPSRTRITYGSAIKTQIIDAGQLTGEREKDSTNESDELLQGDPQSGAFADSAYHSMSTQGEGSDVELNAATTPSKRGRGRKGGKWDSGEARMMHRVKTTRGNQSPTERKRRRYRARSGSSQRDELIEQVVDTTGLGARMVEPPLLEASQASSIAEDAAEGENLRSEVGVHDQSGASRSTGRQRRRPRRYSIDMVEVTPPESTHTKPSVKKRGRPKKDPINVSVVIDEDELPLHPKGVSSVLDSHMGLAHSREISSQCETVIQFPLGDQRLDTPKKKRGRPPKVTSTAAPPPFNDPSLPGTSPTAAPGYKGTSIVGDQAEQLKTLLQDESFKKSLTVLKTRVIEGLTGKRRLHLVGLDDEYQKVHQLVEQTIVAGEGNSMLVIGARGSAKTTLIETVVSELDIEHREDFHVVRLNGFIHTDDKIALKEIWRQLGREMEVDDETMGARSNYADTLSSLLALLSHPAELALADTDTGHAAKSVVFIMDEFDLFASHPRQTLLYNLFDIAQSRKAPIAVLGLTTKIDVVESLEKRVKSRFSHRHVHLSLPKTFAAFRDICKTALSYESSHDPFSSTGSFTHRLEHENPTFRTLLTAWNAYIVNLLDADPSLDRLLQRIYTHTKSVPTFLTACIQPIVSLSVTHIPIGSDFSRNPLLPPDSKINLLAGLSELDFSILIAAARLDIILDTDTCNFNMAYDEYSMLAGRVKVQSSASGAIALGAGAKFWGKEVALAAWENLAKLDLIVPALGSGGGGGGGDTSRGGRMWKVDIGLEEIGGCGLEMSGVVAKWCREI